MFSELWKHKVNKTALLTERTYVLSNQRSPGNYFEKTIFVSSVVVGVGAEGNKCFIISSEERISNPKNLCHFNRRQNSSFISISVLLIIKLIFQSLNSFNLNHLSHISASLPFFFSIYLFPFSYFLLPTWALTYSFHVSNFSFFSVKIHCQACKSSCLRSLATWVWSPEPMVEGER